MYKIKKTILNKLNLHKSKSYLTDTYIAIRKEGEPYFITPTFPEIVKEKLKDDDFAKLYTQDNGIEVNITALIQGTHEYEYKPKLQGREWVNIDIKQKEKLTLDLKYYKLILDVLSQSPGLKAYKRTGGGPIVIKTPSSVAIKRNEDTLIYVMPIGK